MDESAIGGRICQVAYSFMYHSLTVHGAPRGRKATQSRTFCLYFSDALGGDMLPGNVGGAPKALRAYLQYVTRQR